MDTSRERDESVERLLRQSLKAPQSGSATDSCLDAETIAAWIDGGLSRGAFELAQSHVADCARCQSLVAAMARTHAAEPKRASETARRPWLAWLVPAAAAAAAVALWVAVPRESRPPVPPAAIQQQATEEKAPEPPAARNDQALETPAAKQEQAAAPPAAVPPSSPPLAAVAPAAPAPKETLASTAAGQITADDAADIVRSADVLARACSADLTALSEGIRAELTASASPSPPVCWLVGRAGTVLLTTDGANWRRIAFPERTDLSAVRATDARTATVTATDGRMFTTSDGGTTWERR